MNSIEFILVFSVFVVFFFAIFLHYLGFVKYSTYVVESEYRGFDSYLSYSLVEFSSTFNIYEVDNSGGCFEKRCFA